MMGNHLHSFENEWKAQAGCILYYFNCNDIMIFSWQKYILDGWVPFACHRLLTKVFITKQYSLLLNFIQPNQCIVKLWMWICAQSAKLDVLENSSCGFCECCLFMPTNVATLWTLLNIYDEFRVERLNESRINRKILNAR